MANPLYFVEEPGLRRNYFRELDRDSNSLKSIVAQIRSGEIQPIKILEVDEETGRVENITAEVMANARAPLPDEYRFTGEDRIAWEHDRRRALQMAE